MIVVNSECMFFYGQVLEGSGFHVVPNLYPSGYYPTHLDVYLREDERLNPVKITFWEGGEVVYILGDYGLNVKQLEAIAKYTKRTAREIEWEDGDK